jgi:hypothetical protein
LNSKAPAGVTMRGASSLPSSRTLGPDIDPGSAAPVPKVMTRRARFSCRHRSAQGSSSLITAQPSSGSAA